MLVALCFDTVTEYDKRFHNFQLLRTERKVQYLGISGFVSNLDLQICIHSNMQTYILLTFTFVELVVVIDVS